MAVNEELDLGALERRTKAVAAVGQVLHALWGISRAQLPRVEAAAAEASQYLDWVDQVVDRLAGSPVTRASGEILLVVFGPERAYCGPLARQLLSQLPSEHALGLVGARLIEAARTQPGVLERARFQLAGPNSESDLEGVASSVAAEVLKLATRTQVELLYPMAGSAGLRRVVLLSLERAPRSHSPDTYSPLSLVLRHALEEALTSRLTVAAAEALRAEVKARVTAAEQAKKACDDKLAELERSIRVARQEQITGELLEVVSGRLATLRQKLGAR